MTEKPTVTWSAADGVATITLDNPPLNTFGKEAMYELRTCLEEVAADEAVRAVIIVGTGDRFFSAGQDVSVLPEATEPGKGRALAQMSEDLLQRLDEMSKPTICALNGTALGVGCLMAIACDIRIAARNAKLGVPESKLGVFPGGGGTQRLPRVIGEARALEMLYTGNSIDADEAYRIGLVSHLVPIGEALSAAQELAIQIARQSVVVTRSIKEAVHAARDNTSSEGAALEVDMIERVFGSHDAQEGLRAFLEKRKPQFQHR
ncbi:MAG: enoyl-CoA hydratase [Chloroflexota bacterium]|nr:MAG: enoyl-CoA hydratase [Chloroflexota bacterium]